MFSRALEDLSHEQAADNTFGAAFIGVIVASISFGITSLQTYLYYHHFPRDTLLHKVAVGVLWGLDCLHLALTTHAVYYYLISNFGNVHSLLNIVWSIKLQVLLSVLIILIVQGLYAYRVWLLGGYHNGVLGYLVIGVVAGGFAIGVVFVYSIYTTHTFPELESISWAVNSSLAAATAIDFIISIAMCFYLRKSQGSESRLDSRISTIMQYALGSGALTSACSLTTIFTYTLLPNSLVFLGLEFILTQLYVLSFLAMMNARTPTSRDTSHGVASLSTSLPRTPYTGTSATQFQMATPSALNDWGYGMKSEAMNTSSHSNYSPTYPSNPGFPSGDSHRFVKLIDNLTEPPRRSRSLKSATLFSQWDTDPDAEGAHRHEMEGEKHEADFGPRAV